MKKRVHERVSLDMKVSVIHPSSEFTGRVTNISRNGMYIETRAPLPFQSKFDLHKPFKTKFNICINCNGNDIEVPVRVKRLVGSDDSFTGMGVMLQNPSKTYMDFLSGLAIAN